MLCLFRRKIFSVVKYFRLNDFSEKMILLKIFFGVCLVRKNHNDEKSPTAICAGFRPIWLESNIEQSDSGEFGQILVAKIRIGRIPVNVAEI
jgi:hypothetical protein